MRVRRVDTSAAYRKLRFNCALARDRATRSGSRLNQNAHPAQENDSTIRPTRIAQCTGLLVAGLLSTSSAMTCGDGKEPERETNSVGHAAHCTA